MYVYFFPYFTRKKKKNSLREFEPQNGKKFKKTQAEFKNVVSILITTMTTTTTATKQSISATTTMTTTMTTSTHWNCFGTISIYKQTKIYQLVNA